MTTDPFTETASVAANERFGTAGNREVWMEAAAWARTHLAARRAEEVRAWAVQQYPSGTPLDQDRRMVAAETEAYLSGRTERDMSELAQAAKHAGPVDPPAQEPTDAEVEAAARLLNLRGWTCFDGAHEPGEYDQCEQCRIACTGLARSVINTARAALAKSGEQR